MENENSGDFRSLSVYKKAYELALEVYEMSKSFPNEEKYSLTSQIRRSARSVCANIAEAYRKRIYPNHFISKISDADGECSETLVWLDFSKDSGYISEEKRHNLSTHYKEVGKMLGGMLRNPEKFLPK